MNRSASTNPRGLALLALAGCMAVGCSSGEMPGTPWTSAPLPAASESNTTPTESAEARALVAAIRNRYGTAIQQRRLQQPQPLEPLLPAAPSSPEGAPDIIPAAAGISITRDGAFLRPELPPLRTHAFAHRVEVLLPIQASGAFQVKDTSTGMAVDVSLAGAADTPAEVTGSFVLYPRAAPNGADILHRLRLDGTEDYLHFDHAPDEKALHYEIVLNEHVAGLRLVANALEFLDTTGAPRLRMAPPSGVDSRGERFVAAVSLDGCAYDTDPRGPWGRPVVAPGAARCAVHVRWNGADVQYPALIDPMWMSAQNMSTAREAHTASVLAGGKVLVAGGATAGIAWLSSAELYDPASDTWAMTASMGVARANHSQAVLAGDKVLIAGGHEGPTAHSSAEIYDPAATGMWAPTTAPMSTPRYYHKASLLANGKVLVAGGVIAAGAVSNMSEIYDPGTGWSVPTQMSAKRYLYTEVVLADGKVLVLGGMDGTVNLKSAELYDPVANTWTPTGDMACPHQDAAAGLLPNGKVLVVGGVGDLYAVATAELYDPVQRQFSDAAVADLSAVRYGHTATVLPSGKVLVAGGVIGGQGYIFGELYDPALNTWSHTENMSSPRVLHTASVLASGTVLVAGGNTAAMSLNTAELFLLLPGDTCTAPEDCGSGYCEGGVCCNSECAGTCQNGLLDTAVCNSNGDCQHPAQVSCFPYACDGTTACKSSCSAAADCAQGFQCNAENACIPGAATCIDNHTLQDIGGGTLDCAPYRCEGRACLHTCASAGDCIAPNECDALSRQCIAPGTGSADQSGGCALTTPASSEGPCWHWLAAIAIGGWLARRRAAPPAVG